MPTVPPLALSTASSSSSSWLYEAFVVYDAASDTARASVDAICDHLLENGVRTFKNLNEPGSLTSRSGYALAMSTTSEAIVSAGVTIVLSLIHI